MLLSLTYKAAKEVYKTTIQTTDDTIDPFFVSLYGTGNILENIHFQQLSGVITVTRWVLSELSMIFNL